MALTQAVISFDISDLAGADFDPRRTKVYATNNVVGGAVIDTDGNKVYLGSGNATIGADGTGSISVPIPGVGSNPANWQTTIHVDYPDRNTPKGRATRSFGPFTITASANLADLVPEQEVPAEYVTLVTAQLDAKVTEAETAATSAAASAAQAKSVAEIDTSDALVTTLVNDPASTTKAALSATFAPASGSTAYAPASLASTAPGLRSFAQPRRGTPTVITQFDTGHGWDMGGTGWASKSIGDTADFATGTQSFRWTTNGTGNLAYVQKVGLALDLTDKQLRVWFKVDDFTNIAKFQLIAGNSGLSSYYWADTVTSAGTEKFRIYKTGDWACVTFIPDMMNTSGTPTRSAIDTIRIIGQDNAAGAVTFRVDRIEAVPEGTVFPSGVVSLCFDDSYQSAYTVGMPKLGQYGYRGTLFPIRDNIGTGGFLTQSNLDSLAFNSGWEVGAHATSGSSHGTGLDGMTQAQRVAELTALRQWQQQRGYSSDSFAWPNGSWDVASINDVRQFYATARIASRDFHETQYPPQPYRIKAINPTTQTLAQMQNEVAKAKTAATWCVFVFHDIVTTKSKANDVTTADFQALIDYINAQAVPVRTMGEVTRALST